MLAQQLYGLLSESYPQPHQNGPQSRLPPQRWIEGVALVNTAISNVICDHKELRLLAFELLAYHSFSSKREWSCGCKVSDVTRSAICVTWRNLIANFDEFFEKIVVKPALTPQAPLPETSQPIRGNVNQIECAFNRKLLSPEKSIGQSQAAPLGLDSLFVRLDFAEAMMALMFNASERNKNGIR